MIALLSALALLPLCLHGKAVFGGTHDGSFAERGPTRATINIVKADGAGLLRLQQLGYRPAGRFAFGPKQQMRLVVRRLALGATEVPWVPEAAGGRKLIALDVVGPADFSAEARAAASPKQAGGAVTVVITF